MNFQEINLMLVGASVLAGCAIALFFWRFWKDTSDRFFIFFAAAFFLLGIEPLCLELFDGHEQFLVYFIRLIGFLLILSAIVDKNRK